MDSDGKRLGPARIIDGSIVLQSDIAPAADRP
jgi:hypothetical protein